VPGVMGHGRGIGGCKLRARSWGLWAWGCKLGGLRTAGCGRLLARGCGLAAVLWAVGSGLQALRSEALGSWTLGRALRALGLRLCSCNIAWSRLLLPTILYHVCHARPGEARKARGDKAGPGRGKAPQGKAGTRRAGFCRGATLAQWQLMPLRRVPRRRAGRGAGAPGEAQLAPGSWRGQPRVVDCVRAPGCIVSCRAVLQALAFAPSPSPHALPGH